MKWWNILKIEPRDNPLSDEFESPEIPQLDRNKLNPKGKPHRLLNNFPIAKKLFEISPSMANQNILRVENHYWIYDNSYFTLAFNTKFDESILKEHDLKSTSMDVDLFLDAVLDFFLTIDPNYQKRTEALEVYATSIYDFLLQRYKGRGKSRNVVEGSISDAMEILQSFEGKTKPVEIVIQETFDAIKEGDTEIDWENMSEYYDSDFDFLDLEYGRGRDINALEGQEDALGEYGMVEEDFDDMIEEEELRRRRNRG